MRVYLIKQRPTTLSAQHKTPQKAKPFALISTEKRQCSIVNTKGLYAIKMSCDGEAYEHEHDYVTG